MRLRRDGRMGRATSGETLTETLVALLISTLGILLLTTSIVSAININRAATARDQDLRSQKQAAELQYEPAGTGTVTVAVDGKETAVDVTFYGGDDISSYALSTGAGD